jgi:hypothetical protein
LARRWQGQPGYELCQISDPALAGPGVLEELATERAALLAEKIKELGGAERALLGAR